MAEEEAGVIQTFFRKRQLKSLPKRIRMEKKVVKAMVMKMQKNCLRVLG